MAKYSLRWNAVSTEKQLGKTCVVQMIFSIQVLYTTYFVINVLGKECNISKHRYTIRNDVFLIRYCSLFSKEALHWYSLFENQYVEGKIHFIVVNKNIPFDGMRKRKNSLAIVCKVNTHVRDLIWGPEWKEQWIYRVFMF